MSEYEGYTGHVNWEAFKNKLKENTAQSMNAARAMLDEEVDGCTIDSIIYDPSRDGSYDFTVNYTNNGPDQAENIKEALASDHD